MSTLGGELGVVLKFVVSDAVDRPNVLVINGSKAGLVDAKSKYGIAGGLCSLGGVVKSCVAFREEVNRTRACVKRYGLTEDTVIYLYSKFNCIYCDRTTPLVDSLSGEVSFNDTYPYRVKKADENSSADRKLLDVCFGSFINLDLVPQVICPKNGDSISGEVDTLSTLRDFADKCVGAM